MAQNVNIFVIIRCLKQLRQRRESFLEQKQLEGLLNVIITNTATALKMPAMFDTYGDDDLYDDNPDLGDQMWDLLLGDSGLEAVQVLEDAATRIVADGGLLTNIMQPVFTKIHQAVSIKHCGSVNIPGA